MGLIKIKKPEAIAFDLSGTATKSHFIQSILLPYAKANVKRYCEMNWNNPVFQRDLERLREHSKQDNGPPIKENDAPTEVIQKSICDYINAAIDDLRDNDGVKIFELHMWFDGYNRNLIETPVYSDVAIQIKHWRINQNVKLYVLSNGWTEACKRFMSKTNHGDLNLLVEDHFDTKKLGPLNQPETYRELVQKIQITSDRVLFLTKSAEEGQAARAAGINAILVLTHRRNIAKLTNEERSMPFIRTFNELSFFNEARTNAVSSSGMQQSRKPSSADSNSAISSLANKASSNSKMSPATSLYNSKNSAVPISKNSSFKGSSVAGSSAAGSSAAGSSVAGSSTGKSSTAGSSSAGGSSASESSAAGSSSAGSSSAGSSLAGSSTTSQSKYPRSTSKASQLSGNSKYSSNTTSGNSSSNFSSSNAQTKHSTKTSFNSSAASSSKASSASSAASSSSSSSATSSSGASSSSASSSSGSSSVASSSNGSQNSSNNSSNVSSLQNTKYSKKSRNN